MKLADFDKMEVIEESFESTEKSQSDFSSPILQKYKDKHGMVYYLDLKNKEYQVVQDGTNIYKTWIKLED